MSHPASQPLTEAEIEELDAFLFSERVPEDALDFLGLHGFLTALAVAPQPVPTAEWLSQVFDGEPDYASADERQRIEGLILKELHAIGQELYNEEELGLPCELTLEPEDDEEEAALTVWCQGFMEAVFLRESEWFARDEQRIAELLLPMMVISGLFDDPELSAMRDDDKLSEQLCEEVPEVVTDLYLFYRAPEEKPGFKPKAPAKGKGAAKGSKKGKR